MPPMVNRQQQGGKDKETLIGVNMDKRKNQLLWLIGYNGQCVMENQGQRVYIHYTLYTSHEHQC